MITIIRDRVSIRVENRVADVRLLRPDKTNAIDAPMFEAIGEAVDTLAEALEVRAVVLSGDGPAFCAGLDLRSIASGGSGLASHKRRDNGAILPQHISWGWRQLPMPVIAAVHGVSFGGGFQMMSGADIRLAAPNTRFAIREGHWGVVPDMAGFPLWRTLVRDDVLRELIYTAREFDAREALQFGFVTRIVDDPLAAAKALATTIAERSPHAVRGAKRLCAMMHDADPVTMLEAESVEQLKVIGKPNMREAVAASIERRPPVFQD
jgi:enoyl-CoA hydratase/carnithine racemase